MEAVKNSSSQKASIQPRATIALLLVLCLVFMTRAQDPTSPLRFPGKVLADEAGGRLFIADSNHHRIIVTDLEERVLKVIGSAQAGFTDGDVRTARFLHPQGLALADPNTLFGNVDDRGDEVHPEGLEDEAFRGEEVWLEPQRVAAGAGQVVLEVRLPEGYKANYLAPFSIAWRSEGAHVVAPEHASRSVESPHFPLRLEFPAHFFEGEALLTGNLTIYYCREGADAVCLIERVRLRLPVTVEREGTSALSLTYQASELEPW